MTYLCARIPCAGWRTPKIHHFLELTSEPGRKVKLRILNGRNPRKIFHLNGKTQNGPESADLNLCLHLCIRGLRNVYNNSFGYLSEKKTWDNSDTYRHTHTHNVQTHTNRCGKIVSAQYTSARHMLNYMWNKQARDKQRHKIHNKRNCLVVWPLYTVVAIHRIVKALCMFQTGCRIRATVCLLTYLTRTIQPNWKFKGDEELVQFSKYTAQ